MKLGPHFKETNAMTYSLGEEIRAGERGELIPPVCLVPTPTIYVFGQPPTQTLATNYSSPALKGDLFLRFPAG